MSENTTVPNSETTTSLTSTTDPPTTTRRITTETTLKTTTKITTTLKTPTSPTTTLSPSNESTTSSSTTVLPVLTSTAIPQCPELLVPHAAISTELRTVGTIVSLKCDDHSSMHGSGILLCQKSGYWNSSLPTCRGDEHVIPLSTKLFIGILTGCCAMVLLVVVAILLKLWLCGKGGSRHKPSRFSDRHHRLPRSSVDSLPPVPSHMHYQNDRVYNVYQGTLSKASDRGSSIYAKPEIYSTFINPAFYEDVYDRWRRRGSEEQYSAGTIYDSPWQHSKRPDEVGEDAAAGGGEVVIGPQLSESSRGDMRWSQVSLRAHDGYDYGRFGKIPRAQIYESHQSIDTNL